MCVTSLPQRCSASLALQTLPPTFSTLVQLRAVGLTSNRLNGALPTTWGTLSALSYLSLASNAFSGNVSLGAKRGAHALHQEPVG